VPESLLAILKLCALALLYLFFLRVVRAVWAEVAPVRTATGPTPTAPKPRAQRRVAPRRAAKGEALVLVEPREQKGARYAIAEELTMGRAAGCTVTVDDNYASQLHARVFQRDGMLHVEDLGSTNGTYVNGQKITGATPISRGDRVKVGATVFEVQA
jgi:pSer/pThr/pTyr-binding forkhead associated (FHA) protein